MNIAPNLQPISSRSLNIHRPIQLLIGVTVLISASVSVETTITFDDNYFVHGSEVNSQINGVIISANNLSGGPNIAVDFDPRETGPRDSDLEDPSSGGNIDSHEVLVMLLMIQENSVEFEPGGSGALGNIVSTALPEPSVLVPFSIGLAAMGLAHRRQRKAL